MYLKVICAWCGKYIGTKEVFGTTDEPTLPVTHCICPKCKAKLEEEIKGFSSTNLNHKPTTRIEGDKS